MRSAGRSRDDSLLRLRNPLPSRGEGPALFEQWGAPLEETRALLLIERCQGESLQNNLRCSALSVSPRVRLLTQQLSITIPVNDCSQRFWTVCGCGDAGLLCAGKAQPVVYLCFRMCMRPGFSLWLFARRLAVWRSGIRVVSGGAVPLVAGPFQTIISWSIETRDSIECSY